MDDKHAPAGLVHAVCAPDHISAKSPALLGARLRQFAAASPEHTAVIDAKGSTSYGQLCLRMAQIQDVLRGLIQPGEHLALVADNSADYVATVYGAWAAGAVVAGLNTSLKEADLLSQIAHCRARLVVLDSKHAARLQPALAKAGVAVLGLQELPWPDMDTEAEAGPDAQNAVLSDLAPPPITRPSDPATIIYTSGTTGLPKGVMLSHGNLAANVAAVQHSLPIQPDDITLCLLPFFYAYGSSVLHTHMSVGATLVLENSFMYPHKVLQRAAELGVTALYGVPSTYHLLLERDHLAHADLSALRYAAQAGGAMDPARIGMFCAQLPHCAFYVMYGQTEACSRLSTLPAQDLTNKPGSVGLPLPGVALSIRDAQGQALPTGEIGEVCAQGPNVMLGYWQAPADTAQVTRNGWLWTGDLGYLDAQGYLFLTGRSREMIKAGAHRISPWEIEQVIQSVPGVAECAVMPMADHLLGEVVRACVIADAPTEALRRGILQACKAQLAAYKIPRQIDFCSYFPRTASGKIQKALLQSTLDGATQNDPSH